MKDKRTKKLVKNLTNQFINNEATLETELLKFISDVQNSGRFFDLRGLKVLKQGENAFFCFENMRRHFPAKYITDARARKEAIPVARAAG